MLRPRRILTTVALAGAGIAAGIAGISAAPALTASAPVAANLTAETTSPAAKPAHHGGVHPRLAELVAKDTGLTLDQVRTQLTAGRSLDQIAGDKAQAVKDAALDAVKVRLDKVVASGKITAAQETDRLGKLKDVIAKAMAATG